MTARTRALATFAAGALALPLSPFAAPAHADHIDVQPTTTACPPDQVGENAYDDVEDDNLFVTQINCITDYGVALGKTASTYAPAENVLRRQMALFIYRVGVAAGVDFDTETDPGFSDDDDLDTATRDAVWGLANAGVVLGVGDGSRYAPNGLVTRGQMASFIARVQDDIEVDGFETDEDFFDDDDASVHEDNINRIAAEGITIGRGGDRQYAPLENVTRQQMAGFLGRKLNVLVEQGFVENVYDEEQPGGVTDAPELVTAEFVRQTGAEGAERTTVRFTFDEDVIAAVSAGDFHLETFDGTRFDGVDASRESGAPSSVLVVFGDGAQPLDADTFSDVTVATVDVGAVSDADGSANPIEDAAIGDGVATTAGRTDAPDVVSAGSYRAEPVETGETSNRTLVDVVFDEPAFVVDEEGFELVLQDGTEVPGTAVDTTGDEDDDIDGDGTTTITVAFANAAGNEPRTAGGVARVVVQQGTVSDDEVTPAAPPAQPQPTTEGATNPLQVTDARTATSLPDLASVALDQDANTVTYTFDEVVRLAPGATNGFAVYDSEGVQTSGTPAPDELPVVETTADTTVVVEFEASELDDVAGANVAEGAVVEDLTAGARPNQEDELPVASAATPAGATLGPDLTDVTRSSETTTEQDPITGETTSSTTRTTLTYVFDEDVLEDDFDGFAVVLPNGEQVDVSASCALTETAADGDENTVVCEFESTTDEDGEQTPGAGFEAAEAAVAGAVDDSAVVDDEGDDNPEGVEVLATA